MQRHKIPLPIDSHIDGILSKYQNSSTLLIKASPGSGKTTRLPWAIAKNASGKVLVLEPRRLAAKLAAQRIAQEEGLNLGEEVGYHFRFERKMNENTRLIFYTEGTFLKKLLSDPELEGVDAVILDEFHERHLDTDVALAYLRSVQRKKSELKIILMSATLDLKTFPDAEIINIEAPYFPIAIHHLTNQPSILNAPLENKIRDALEKSNGDTLIFLPGMREILKVKAYLGENYGEIFILHSETEKQDQEAALQPSSKRKIILSTNIAESSVTIPGIKCVIDSGIQREAHFSPWNGLKIISDYPVTKASAIQRTGRAGRTGPGECYRLYSQFDFQERDEFNLPEINRADLLSAYLMSLQFKYELNWYERPPKERWDNAIKLATLIGLTNDNSLTEQGKQCLSLPVEPRIARVIIEGEKLNTTEKQKLLQFISELENDQGLLSRRLKNFFEKEGQENHWEKALLAGFIDQLSYFRLKHQDFIHFSGKVIKSHYSLKALEEGFYLILDFTQKQEAIKVISVEESWLYEIEPFPFSEDKVITSDFKISSITKIGSIVIDESKTNLNWEKMSSEEKKKLIEITQRSFEKEYEAFEQSDKFGRYYFWAKLHQEIEKITTPRLEDYYKQFPILSFDHLVNFFENDLVDKLKITNLDSILPTSISFGRKKELKIHYSRNLDPFIEAPIQDFYGIKTTPKLANNFPITLRLLGPHKRPLQVTKDLDGFWKKTYVEMKKELQREYPKHYWPDDPQSAIPYLLKRHLKS
jgi:ATP-dependent helicase HrpB